jgi:flagella basal body P-ring formation protein FlgA
LLLQAGVANATEVSLKMPLEVDGAKVTLADLFNGVAPEDAAKELAAAPAPGQTITLQPSWIATAARHFGYTWQPGLAPKSVTLKRRSQTISGEDITRAIVSYLQQQTGERDLDVALINRSLKVDVATSVTPFVQVETAQVDQLRQTVNATVRIAVADGQETSLSVSGQLHRLVQVPVLTVRKASGDIIEARDLSFRPARQQEVGPQVILDVDKLTGMTPRRFVAEGTPIRDGDLISPVLVQKNELVTVILKSGSMYLSMQGPGVGGGGQG